MMPRMLSRVRAGLDPLLARWRRLGWRRQLIIGGAATAIVVATGAAIAVVALSGGPSRCTEPVCVEVLSPKGDKVHPMTPVRMRVSGTIDRDVALRSLQISNEPKGTKTFEGDVLTFRPEWPGFARGESYEVVLALPASVLPPGASAEPVRFSFTTDGELGVAYVYPKDGAREVGLDTPLMIQFNRSVAPLAVLGSTRPEDILKIQPPTEGNGEWLNTSLYTFTPAAGGWNASAQYTVTVKAGLANRLGARLHEDYTFAFTTVSPAVASVSPPEGSLYVAPQPDVTVTFNQPVDQASAEASFVLTPSGSGPVAGAFTWTDSRTFVFRPSQPLPLGGPVQAVVKAGVRAQGSQAAMAEDYVWTFTTVGVPTITQTEPLNGSQSAPIGSVRITFSNPMDPQSVEDNISVLPKPEDDLNFFWEPSNLRVNVYYGGKPSTAYRVTLTTDAKDRYGQPLAAPLDLSFVTSPLQPYFWLTRGYGSGTFNAYLDPTITVHSVNLSQVDFELYRLDRDAFIQLDADPYRYPTPPGGQLVRRWSEAIPNPPLNTTVTTSTRLAAEGTTLPEGTYALRASAPGASQPPTVMPIVISSANVVTKYGRDGLLAWIVDLQSGAPLAGLPVTVLRGTEAVAAGATDENGLVRLYPPPLAETEFYRGYYLWAQRDSRVILSNTSWNYGISPWDLAPMVDFRYDPPSLMGYLYTDRPIYRPGERVYLKGIVRRDDDARYSVPEPIDLTLSVRSPDGALVDSRAVTISAAGTFNTSLTLGPEAATGLYYVQLEQPRAAAPDNAYMEPVATVSFRVAEFRKPEFQVQVTPDKKDYVNGENIQATVAADLFFGAPLADAEVAWNVTAAPYGFRPAGFPGFNFGDFDERFQFFMGPSYEQQQFLRGQGVGRTDAQGRFAFGVPADVSADKQSQTFTLEATVTDQNQQTVSAIAEVTVHKGQFYIGLRPASWIAYAGSPTQIDLVTVDQKAEPVPNTPLRISVYLRKWRTVRERDSEGDLIYRSEYEDTLEQTISASTDAEAKGSVTITPGQAGQYYIVAEGSDAAGNTVRSSAFLWVSSSSFASWFIGNGDVIQLVADRNEYHPGETARILVASPFDGSRGLVTLERGRLLDYSLRDFPTNSEVLQVPITSDHIPNVFVGVVLFKPPTPDNPSPQVKFGLVELKVSTDEKELRISIKPDRARLGPSESVTYTIETTDSKGQGVPAELSLSLVDLSVLSLQDEFAEEPVKAFWRAHPLGIMTGSSFALSIDRANQLSISRGGAGVGGKGGGGALGERTRTYFPNTAYWEPALVTGADGRATIVVTLPDTLTTWRLTARGITPETMVGQAKVDVTTYKDVLIRPAFPRFLVAGDQAYLGAIVHNLTSEAMALDVSLAADGLDVASPASRTVAVAAGESALVRWDTTARVDASSATITISAAGGGKSDSVQVSLPVYSFVTPETMATAGEVTGAASEAIEVPYYVRPDSGELTVNVSPSLAAGMNTALVYLDEYPWESAETTVSRFLPRLALRQAIQALGITDIDIGENSGLPGLEGADDLVRRSLQRLSNQQHQDGGWGWWVEDDSDPAITAYVVTGLAAAKHAGFSVDADVESRAADYLRGQIDQRRDVADQEFDLRAYLLYALALDGHGDLGRSFAFAEQKANLGNAAKAWTALAILLTGGAKDDPRLTGLMDDLQKAAIPSATGNHWEEATYDRAVFSNSVLVTAQVLQAFTHLEPEHPLVDGTLRWLMVARKEGRWESPHDTALAIAAIADFLQARKEAQGAFEYAVAFNGEIRLQGRSEAGKIHQEDTIVIPMADILKDTVNRLDISRSPASAAGRLYYTAHLRYFTPAEEIEAANRGISVSHQYFVGEDETPVQEAKLGDIVRIKVTLVAPNDLNFLVLEDFLPAGLEPIDTSLKTTASEFTRLLYQQQVKEYEAHRRLTPFSHTDIRDNRVALFARFVPKGVYEYTYYAQATTPGQFNVPPATAYEQYFPEVWGRSDGGRFTVSEEESAAWEPAPATRGSGGVSTKAGSAAPLPVLASARQARHAIWAWRGPAAPVTSPPPPGSC